VRCLVLVSLALSAPAYADGSARLAANETVAEVARGDVRLPILVVEPKQKPIAIVVLFTGGNGALGLSRDGIAHGADNFVVRTRQRYADAGMVAVVVDVPDDQKDGIDRYRVSEQHAKDIQLVIEFEKRARGRDLPVWLVGTSRGTISAANAAARGVAVAGVVLTSSVTAGRKAKLDDIALDRIATRVLVVHHERDACAASPFAGGKRLATQLHATFRAFDGGASPTGDACGPNSYHGYLGLDAEVTAAIVEFIGKT
jgi:hypothetical protein